MQGLYKSILDSLYYLGKEHVTLEDLDKAQAILRARADEITPGLSDRIAGTPHPADVAAQGFEGLLGRHIAVWVGHHPSGGAEGERDWNIELARHIKQIGEESGAIVKVFKHTVKNYTRRQDRMRARMLKEFPEAELAMELHYDAVSNNAVHGYHFQYYGTEDLAFAFRNRMSQAFPHAQQHQGDGLLRNTNGNGAGFLRKCPVPAVLCEPFFRSNPNEWEFYQDKFQEMAAVYLRGCSDFLMAS